MAHKTKQVFQDQFFMEEEVVQYPKQNKAAFGSMCSIQEQMEPEVRNIYSINFIPTQATSSSAFFNQVLGYGCFFSDEKLKLKISKKSQLDRFVPNRKHSKLNVELNTNQIKAQNYENIKIKADNQNNMHSMADIYKKHILGLGEEPLKQNSSFKNRNYLKFSQKELPPPNYIENSKSLLNIKQQITNSFQNSNRKISKVPIKILDAPALQDDFYLNLLDWSSNNLLAVALSNALYIWDASTSKVKRLTHLQQNLSITSTAWSPSHNNILSFGTQNGLTQIWDVCKSKKVRIFDQHSDRVGAISWNNNNVFSTGSRDRTILNRDLRDRKQFIQKFTGHKQQICGLKWSFDHQQLASGGNDNKLLIWNNYSTSPIFTLNKHIAAVKALAWSPHQHGLLVSGGGTTDKKIRFWNTINGQCTKVIDGKSQICNLMFSKTVNQLISTHGFSQNQINIWRIPNMEKITTLIGHTSRVLFLSMSPNGSTIVTGAGDETLRFWNVFPSKQVTDEQVERSQLISQFSCLR